MRYKLVATDVDGVVKPYYDPVPREIAELLREISEYCSIVFLSGRQVTWLEGLIYGMGLRPDNIVLVGEEGSVIYYPKNHKIEFPLDKIELEKFSGIRNKLKNQIEDKFGGRVFIPCTNVILTIAAEELFDRVNKYVLDFLKKNDAEGLCRIIYHRTHNVIQVFPSSIDKYVALRMILRENNVQEEEIIALGDGLNDIPILERAGVSIAVGENREVKKVAKKHFLDPKDAFEYVLSLVKH